MLINNAAINLNLPIENSTNEEGSEEEKESFYILNKQKIPKDQIPENQIKNCKYRVHILYFLFNPSAIN